nr:hypothetical protein [Tanacetum cinerariifolium]
IAQSLALPPIPDKPASPIRDVSQGEACPTDSGFVADHDRANIAKTSTLPHESTSRVTSLAADEGTQALEITELKARVKFLEERQGEGEVAAERVSDDIEEIATVLITMDTASVLSSGGVQVVPTNAAVSPANVSISTGSEMIPTASIPISPATPIFATATTVTSYTRRKGNEKMVETHTPKKKKRLQEQTNIPFARELEEEFEREARRMNAQIARDEEIVKIHVKEELQQMIEGLDRSNETIAKHLEEYKQVAAELTIRERIELIFELVKYQDHHSKILQYQAQQRKTRTKKQKRDFYMAVIRNNLGWKVKDFKGMSFEEVEAKFKTVWKQMEGFIPMGSKEEGERIKRKGLNLEQERAKKQKTSKEVLEEAMSPEEVIEDKVKEMMQLVPIEEVYAEALQVKHPIIDWKRLVKETLSNRPPTSEKEMELWIELNRMYEPDKDDQL